MLASRLRCTSIAARRVTEALPLVTAPRYLLRERCGSYGRGVQAEGFTQDHKKGGLTFDRS